ncbi:MAG TPA: efflux RND transporter periplasmic adaptor subunit [Thermoanaerobaculia bacterium]|nr:efflux RND transporter periplasmic adaptor subunit [Thermoanaerobaculia bacterium]
MKKFFGILAGLLFVVILVGTGVLLYKKSQRKPVVYQTAQATRTDIVKKTVATGAVVPRKEIAIKPLVSGIVDELYVEEGQVIAEGALIARVRVIPEMGRLSDAESRVNKAEIALADAERNARRQQELFDQGTVARAELDRAEVALSQAKEELVAARDSLDIVRTGTSARVAKATTTVVRATNAGTVLEVPVEAGDSVIQANNFNEGTTIASVADMGDMIFEGKVDESEVGRLRPGMDLVLTVGALPEAEILATLEHIAPKGVEENGAIQFEIRAAIVPDPDLFLRANYSANADIVLDKREDVLAIDEGLLQFDGEQAYVEVETGPQQFERRDVETGLSDGIQIEIVSGIGADDKIKQPNTDLVAAGPPGQGGQSRTASGGRRSRRVG